MAALRPDAFPATRLWRGTGTWGNADSRRSCRHYVRARIGHTVPDARPAPRYGTVRRRAVHASVRWTEIQHAPGGTHRHTRAQRRRLRVRDARETAALAADVFPAQLIR